MKKIKFLIILFCFLQIKIFAQQRIEFFDGIVCTSKIITEYSHYKYIRFDEENERCVGYLKINDGLVEFVKSKNNNVDYHLLDYIVFNDECILSFYSIDEDYSNKGEIAKQPINLYKMPVVIKFIVKKSKDFSKIYVMDEFYAESWPAIVIRDCKAYNDNECIEIQKGSEIIVNKYGDSDRYEGMCWYSTTKNKKDYVIGGKNVRLYFDDTTGYTTKQQAIDYANSKKKLTKFNIKQNLKCLDAIKLHDKPDSKSNVVFTVPKDSLLCVIEIDKDDYVETVENNWLLLEVLEKDQKGKYCTTGKKGYYLGYDLSPNP